MPFNFILFFIFLFFLKKGKADKNIPNQPPKQCINIFLLNLEVCVCVMRCIDPIAFRDVISINKWLLLVS